MNTENMIMWKWKHLMQQSNCQNRSIFAIKPPWGLTSRIRDFSDVLLHGLISNMSVIHEEGECIHNVTDTTSVDPFMRCVFERFYTCRVQHEPDEAERKEAEKFSHGEGDGWIAMRRDPKVFQREKFADLWQELRLR